jgi:hypothetical protein
MHIYKSDSDYIIPITSTHNYKYILPDDTTDSPLISPSYRDFSTYNPCYLGVTEVASGATMT